MLKKIKGKNFLVKFICLLLSFSLWLYIINVENPIRDLKLNNVPVQITDSDILKDYDLVMMPDQNLTVDLDLEGPSTEIYKVKKEQFKVVVNLSEYVLKEGDNNIPVQIENYPNNINIKNNGFLRVNIVLDKYDEKSLPITNKVKVNTTQGTYADKINLSPENATVSGAQSLVSKVKSLVVKGEIKDVNKDVNLKLPVIAIDEDGKEIKDVSISPSKATVSFGVKKSKEVPVKIVTEGSPKDGLAVKSISPSLNKVTLLGSEEALNKVNYVETSPIDLSQYSDNSEANLTLKIPEGLTLAPGEQSQVNVKLSFSKDVKKEIELPVNIEGSLDGYTTEIDTKSVKITVDGPEDIVNNLDLSKFKCTLDISNLKAEGGSVEPKVSTSYDNLNIGNINPKEIKVTFKKVEENSESPTISEIKPEDKPAIEEGNKENSNNNQ